MSKYDKIIIGCPTWDIGLLQEDWRSKFDDLDNIDFRVKQSHILDVVIKTFIVHRLDA